MDFSFLEDLFKPVGKGFSELDRFVDREMPFDSGWGAPAAAVAAYFGGPALMGSLGQGGAAGVGGAEGAGSVAGGGGILDSIGGAGGSFAGQEAFQLPASAYTPEYLDSLAKYQGVDAGNASYLDRLMGNTEQGLYKQEGLAKQTAGETASAMLKKQAQQQALGQLLKSGSGMQQQGQQPQQAQIPQAMMNRGQGVDTVSALLSLLQEKQLSKQPRISLI
jgi:hypothetical protein